MSASQYVFSVIDPNGNPVSGAVVSAGGSPIGSTDLSGNFRGTFNDSDQISISAPGFQTYSIQAAFMETSEITLTPAGGVPSSGIYTPAGSSNWLPWIIVGGALVLASSGRSKGVGKISSKQGTLIALGAIAVGGVILLSKKTTTTPGALPSTTLRPALPATTSPGGVSQTLTQLAPTAANIFSRLTDLITGGGGSPSSPVFTEPTIAPVAAPQTGLPDISASAPTLPTQGIDFGLANPSYDATASIDTSSIDTSSIDTSSYGYSSPAPVAAPKPVTPIQPQPVTRPAPVIAPKITAPGTAFSLLSRPVPVAGLGGLGQVSADTFSAADIIDKTLIANKTIALYDLPYDNATQIGSVAPGNPVGVVYTYFDTDPQAGRSTLFWGFNNPDGSSYYVPHHVGDFNISSLQQQGVMTDQQKTDAANTPAWLTSIEKYIPYVVGGFVVLGLGKSLITRKNG